MTIKQIRQKPDKSENDVQVDVDVDGKETSRKISESTFL